MTSPRLLRLELFFPAGELNPCSLSPLRSGYAGASNKAQALATADNWSDAFDPGAVAHPPFSMKSPWDHESTFLSAARLAETSVAR